MKRTLIAGAAVLALAACNQKTEPTPAPSETATAPGAATTPPGGAPAPEATPGAAAAPVAADFVAMAAASDMFEEEAAKIAEKRSKNADVKAFAAEMITDHRKSTAMIKKAVTDSGKDITPPTALPDDKKAMIDALNSASAADFDKTYVDQQVMAHKDALTLMQAYAAGGDVPQLKDAAAMLVPVVQMHLDRITTIQSNLAAKG